MNNRKLAELFPGIRFAKDADEYLTQISDVSINNQLQRRLIFTVREKSQFPLGLLCADSLRFRHFRVYLNINSPLEEKLKTLGHEIAHTFQYYRRRDTTLMSYWSKEKMNNMHNTLENFCDEFAEYWLEINGESKVADYYQRFIFCK